MKQLLSISLLVMALGCSLPGCEKADFPGQNGVSMHIYGTQDLDLAAAVVQTGDGGFAIAGSITNLEDSTNEEDIVLIRTNANGELLWRKSYDGIGRDRAEDMLLLSDGGFLIVGQQGSGSLGGVDMVVFRTDAVGEVIWQKNFGGAADDYGTAVVQTTSGEFVAVGYTSSLGTNASTIYPNLLIVKVDAAGNEIWTRAYGGSNEERAFGVSATQDGGVAVAGNVYFDSLDYDAGLWRIGSNGDSLWGYHGITQAQDEGHGVATLANGNLCLLGYTSNGNDFDIFLLTLTDSGTVVQGSLSLLGGDDYDRTLSRSLLQLDDQSLVLAGYTMSFGKGANDFYLVKAAATGTGDYRVDWATTFGGSNDDIARAVIPTTDGGFAVVGYTKSFSFNEQYDIALVVTNSAGELVPVDGE